MPDDAKTFLKALKDEQLTNGERALALLWFDSREDHSTARTPTQLCNELEGAGYPKQNVTRIRDFLARDQRTAKSGRHGFRVRITARASLDERYGGFTRRVLVTPTDSVLPRELFDGTRGYIEKVVDQVNASFDSGLYDCCAVMCRRLLETLIIEAFEAAGAQENLKDRDGHYKMFSGLLAAVESSGTVSLSRNGLQGLKDFKKLGDLSAHNRRFNARENDIARIRDGIRVSGEELLHLAGLA